MFEKVLALILAAANHPVDNRCASETKEDILHVLGTLRRFKTQPQRDGLVEPAIRFVESSAWSLLWTRIRLHQGWRGCEIETMAIKNIDEALRDHFTPIQEEISP